MVVKEVTCTSEQRKRCTEPGIKRRVVRTQESANRTVENQKRRQPAAEKPCAGGYRSHGIRSRAPIYARRKRDVGKEHLERSRKRGVNAEVSLKLSGECSVRTQRFALVQQFRKWPWRVDKGELMPRADSAVKHGATAHLYPRRLPCRPVSADA